MSAVQSTKDKVQSTGNGGPLAEQSFRFAVASVQLVRALPNDTAGRVIGTQYLRSATSVGANVAEAQGGKSRRDFGLFLGHALKSANECRFWLVLMGQSGLVPSDRLEPMHELVESLRKLLGASVATIYGTRKRP
jgi:four helix bundle protein